MTEPVSLADAKAHLKIEAAFTDDDAYITGLTLAARRKVELDTGRSFSGATPTLAGDDAALAVQAILLLVGAWYANREAVVAEARTSPTEVPMSARWIIDALRQYDDGGWDPPAPAPPTCWILPC